MTDRFRWHPDARLLDANGRGVMPLALGGPVVADSAIGLAQVIGLSQFRIGAEAEPAPIPGPVPVFETLTSGSTGAPRRILRTQSSWLASFAVNAGLGIGPDARVAVLGRLVHSLALYGAVEGLHLGAEVHLLDLLRPDRQCAALAARKVTHLYATPAQLRQLGPGDCPDLRMVLVGGSKLDPALRAVVQAMAPFATLREFYGAAETSFITMSDDTTPEGSVGRAYPGVEIGVDPSGEVWVKSPYLFLGYAGPPAPVAGRALPSPLVGERQGGGPAGQARAIPGPAPSLQGGGEARAPQGAARWRDGWLSVGEVGRLEDGFLYLQGRAGRMVTVADQNVFPEEIEAMLEAMPGIARAAVLPVPDPLRGSVLVALVQGDQAREATVLAAMKLQLGPLKAPRSLIWIADWPVLASGKSDLRALEAGLTWPA